MKKLLLVLTIGILLGCESRNVNITTTDFSIEGRVIKTYIIDSCEYIGTVHNNNSDILTHKGNCKYCIKRNSKN